MSEEKLVPKLRFSGFDDEWNEVKLGDISTFLDNKRIPLKEDDRKQIKGEYPYYGASGIIDYVNDYIFDEELILMGEDGANIVTRSSKLIFLAKGKYWVNNHAHVIKADNNINQYFLSESLERINYEKYNTGTAQPKLNREVCQKIKVKIPQFNEQNKIANFLLVIDEKLRLLEQKYQYYQNFKKYLMQQIFTQKLRFTDYIEEWKTIKLKDVGEINTGNTPSTKVNEYYSPKKYLWVTPSDISSKYIFDTAKRLSDEGAKKGRFVKKNSVLVTCIASIGKNCIILEDGYFNQQINSITPSQSFDLDFIYYLIDYNSEKMKNYAGITATPILNKKSFENMKFEFPSFDEQKQISNMLSNIDNKIFAIEELINKTQKFKKGLLQQMFV